MSSALAPSAVSPAASLTLARSLPQGVDELSQMGAYDLFCSQLETGNTEAKVDAMKRLPVVAFAMGPSQVVATLLPYLQTLVVRQPAPEDEILLLLGKQLQTFVPNLLSNPKELLELLPIMERLAAVEETVVRDQAVIGMNHLAETLVKQGVDASVSSALLAMAKRLIGADWFTAKVSVAGMIPELYAVTKNIELAVLYKELCMDETPMVRRAAAQHLGALLQKLASKEKANDLLPVLQQLTKDEQDSVRMLAVASLSKVGPAYGKTPDWTKEYFLPMVKEGSTDLSWYVARPDSPLDSHFLWC